MSSSFFTRRKLALACMLTPAAFLAACGPQTDSAPASASTTPADASPPTYQEIGLGSAGFYVGNAGSPEIFVFFDPQCSHCATLWNESQSLLDRARFKWIPVALLNRASLSQAVALLSAANPVEAMASHEASLKAGSGGISAMASPDEALVAKVKANTALLDRMPEKSVPLMVGRGRDGAVVTVMGARPASLVAQVFGLTVLPFNSRPTENQ